LNNGQGYDPAVNDALYPLFYYQLPESIPNLAIAVGISPPNSILRRAIRWLKYYFCGAPDPSYPLSIIASNNPSQASQPKSGGGEYTDTLSLYMQEAPLAIPSSSAIAARNRIRR
jgi:hypothetical protein